MHRKGRKCLFVATSLMNDERHSQWRCGGATVGTMHDERYSRLASHLYYKTSIPPRSNHRALLAHIKTPTGSSNLARCFSPLQFCCCITQKRKLSSDSSLLEAKRIKRTCHTHSKSPRHDGSHLKPSDFSLLRPSLPIKQQSSHSSGSRCQLIVSSINSPTAAGKDLISFARRYLSITRDAVYRHGPAPPMYSSNPISISCSEALAWFHSHLSEMLVQSALRQLMSDASCSSTSSETLSLDAYLFNVSEFAIMSEDARYVCLHHRMCVSNLFARA